MHVEVKWFLVFCWLVNPSILHSLMLAELSALQDDPQTWIRKSGAVIPGLVTTRGCYSPVEPLTVVGLLLCRPFSASRLMVYSVPGSSPRSRKELLSTGISTSLLFPEGLV